MSLRENQRTAVEASLATNFTSGIHFHATGTGKSWIALELALAFQRFHGSAATNILWICEHKSILTEQFNRTTLSQRGYGEIYKKFMVLDFSEKKPQDWCDQVNSATFWKRPMLIIINRAFLTSSLKYERLRLPIHLVIHDECHTIVNSTTQQFYKWLLREYSEVRCLGFSATPTLAHAPYTRILSQYTIYDACTDGTIVPPTISWLKAADGALTTDQIRKVVRTLLEAMPYKKCLLWCGMIDTCRQYAKEWRDDPAFDGWMVAVDTSEEAVAHSDCKFASYEEFKEREEKALLFCASKHREGSDIYNLDSCVFLDLVANRCPKTFIQCVGRVLRCDPAGKKKTGLVVDVSAWSSIRICDRINAYLNPTGTTDVSTFPFHYSFNTLEKTVQLHTLSMVKTEQAERPVGSQVLPLAHRFVRELPSDPVYSTRLREELELFEAKDLSQYIHRALDILNITNSAKIPHVTRGSCGSSLVCYLLGIGHVDPVRWNIKFARFMNEYRTSLPDIDFDFPHTMRDEVFLQIQMMWPGQVARISNHIHYHKKSALREAIRKAGVRKQLSTLQLHDTIQKMPVRTRLQVYSDCKKLENTFKGYSLHCGGIVLYPEGVPTALKLKTARSATFSQITLNKRDIAKEKQFKIDILSSRALTQLMDARRYANIHDDLHFDAFLTDQKTSEMLRCGDNIGITLAETPLIRKAFRSVQPKTLEDVAHCLAVIRPAANDKLVFDDDVIDILAHALECSDAEADRYRRGLGNSDKEMIADLKRKLSGEVLEALKDVRNYGFCKSHAFSYAQLVWQLAYMKAHYPQAFWRSALKHCDSSYRKWVHLYEARLVGVSSAPVKHASIFAQNRRAKAKRQATTQEEQLRRLGIWEGEEFFAGTYMRCQNQERAETSAKTSAETSAEIRGLIAWTRTISWEKRIKKIACMVGIGPREYVEVLLVGKQMMPTKSIGVTCKNVTKVGDIWIAENPVFW
jgi:superfamily II DNA or RNA helicase